MLKTVEDIKIPYPNEGIIRTASIDDTVTPENSVQLAVNMNFDRIGAIQTRPGVTSYADVLIDGINNYGTLRNNIVPDGYNFIFPASVRQTWLDSAILMSAAKIDSEHIIVFYTNSDDSHGYARVLGIDPDTGEVTALSSATSFEGTLCLYNRCIQIDSTHFLNTWKGVDGDGFARAFSVNTTTWAVTALNSNLEFDTNDGDLMSLAAIDANHFICFYSGGATTDGIATVFAVNLSTWAVTQPGSPFTFSAGIIYSPSCLPIGNGTHFINFWATGGGGKAAVFAVNTGTWAITLAATALTIDSTGYNTCQSLGDGTHFINFCRATSGDGEARTYFVNTSTWAVTSVGTLVTFESGADFANFSIAVGDGEHFVNFWSTSDDLGYAQIFEVDQSTFQLSKVGNPLSIGASSDLGTKPAVLISGYRIAYLWGTADTGDTSVIQIFKLVGDVSSSNFLYAQSGDEIFNTQNGTWTSRRSGLITGTKARFDQYLNYIWMVNGNANLGGDPIATSNGGNFGTDLIPDGFPPGDFISAGFEGRVWVIDKTLGIIYYTDIVQFARPDIYTLSYDPDVNFITTISPQTGQQFTAVQQVPRALLIFTEDYIYRIYGATSIDAYPAYNVGTYSQESIAETKTGIFFHHSSGFYQFDYGSQPVEISRRVIDFVKAIPRTYYDDITGVYDGFDAVEWSVGPVTVEGVAFANCVMRYTISTQVWTIYDYIGNTITAMIQFDDGTTLNHLMGTEAGKTGAMDTGSTDFGEPFYFEYIDRWRSFTEIYAKIKAIDGVNVYSENAAGSNLLYQIQKWGPNVWQSLGTIDSNNSSLLPNATTEDFDVVRLRITGNTKGTPVVIHGIEIMSITIKGFDKN